MSGETRQEVSGWTVDTLHRHIIAVLDERDGRYECRFSGLSKEQNMAREGIGTALVAQEREVAKVDAINERRFDALMTQRRASDDLTRLMMPRNEAETRAKALEEKITDLAARIDRNDGRSGGITASWGFLVAAIIAGSALVNIVMRLVPTSP